MKVTVNKYLNVRVGNPKLNAPCYQYIAPGSELEVEEVLHKGDLYDGINQWYKDAAGNYYWSGGVTDIRQTQIIDYSSYLTSISNDILSTKGEKATITIIDGGVNFSSKNFDNTKTSNLDIDNNELKSYHGTFIAGIICGTNDINGIANHSNVISIKYKSDTTFGQDLLKNFISALQKVNDLKGPLIVNISQFISDTLLLKHPEFKEQILNYLELINQSEDKFLICAAGDNLDITSRLLFPAQSGHCLSVGCVNEFHKNIPVAQNLDILTPMYDFTSYDLSFNKIKNAGCSYSTAVISAIVACVISSEIKKGNPIKKAAILGALQSGSVEKDEFLFNELLSFQYNLK